MTVLPDRAKSGKYLLLTDIPPCKNYTAGIALDNYLRQLPSERLACCAVLNPAITDARLSPDLEHIPMSYLVKPRENGLRLLPGWLGSATACLAESWNAFVRLPRLQRSIEKIIERENVTAIWCVLQGQTMIGLADGLSRLGLPLYTNVWDPLDWWLRGHKVDALSARRILKQFDRVVLNSRKCGTASIAMAEHYRSKYGITAVPLLPSLEKGSAVEPAASLTSSTTLTIGFIGQMYADAEFAALLNALSSVGWNLDGRRVKVVLYGRYLRIHAPQAVNVEFRGYCGHDELVPQLSSIDLLYCPYWFDPQFEREARLSFPSKLTTYLAAGRPVFFHGPAYASPAQLLAKYGAAQFCTSNDARVILASLRSVCDDTSRYRQLAAAGRKLFDELLTLDRLGQSVRELLELDSCADCA